MLYIFVFFLVHYFSRPRMSIVSNKHLSIDPFANFSLLPPKPRNLFPISGSFSNYLLSNEKIFSSFLIGTLFLLASCNGPCQ